MHLREEKNNKVNAAGSAGIFARRLLIQMKFAVIGFCLLIPFCIVSIASSNQSVVLTLIPDTTSPPTSESLNHAREILQKRFDIALPEKARLTASNTELKLELVGKEHLSIATRLVTETGEIVFFLSDTALAIGSTIPDGVSAVITDRDIAGAKPSPAPGNSWSIRVRPSEEGARRLQEQTRGKIGHYMVIAKDGMVISAPFMTSEIGGNEVEIAGTDDVESAILMVAQMASGRLPFKFRIAESR